MGDITDLPYTEEQTQGGSQMARERHKEEAKSLEKEVTEIEASDLSDRKYKAIDMV